MSIEYTYQYTHQQNTHITYGVATIRRLLQIIRLFCRISSLCKGSFTKETYDFNEPTHRSHTISIECICELAGITGVCICACENGCACVCMCVHVCMCVCVCVCV